MTKDEAIEKVIDAFSAWESEYYTGDDWTEEHEARDMAVEALATEAIPIDWIKKRIEDLDEYISKWGGVFEQEAVVNAKIHEIQGLVRMIGDWRAEADHDD